MKANDILNALHNFKICMYCANINKITNKICFECGEKYCEENELMVKERVYKRIKQNQDKNIDIKVE